MIVMEPRMFQNQFRRAAWAKALGATTVHGRPWACAAHWYPVATGALMSWIRQYCEGAQRGAEKLAISLGINIAAIFDPTGGLSLVGAVEASTPWRLSGLRAQSRRCHSILASSRRPRNTRIAARMDALLSEIKVLNDWLTQSKNVLQRSRLAAEAGRQASSSVSAPAPNCCATRAGFAARPEGLGAGRLPAEGGGRAARVCAAGLLHRNPRLQPGAR